MKKYQFKVIFVSGQIETVYAITIEEAKILAQAEQIKKGHGWEVAIVDKISG